MFYRGLKVKIDNDFSVDYILSSSVSSWGLEPAVTSFFFCDIIITILNLYMF